MLIKDLEPDTVYALLHQRSGRLHQATLTIAGKKYAVPVFSPGSIEVHIHVEMANGTAKVFMYRDRERDVFDFVVGTPEPAPVKQRTMEQRVRDIRKALDGEYADNEEFRSHVLNPETEHVDGIWLRNAAELWVDYEENPMWSMGGVNCDPNHPDNLARYVGDTWLFGKREEEKKL
ncbi:hypothetical protein [Vibrio phage vB_pir03]|nr:hypothetical protein [Vibrio phage vB_pir03]